MGKKKEAASSASESALKAIAKIEEDAKAAKMEHIQGLRDAISEKKKILRGVQDEIEELENTIAEITGKAVKSSSGGNVRTKLTNEKMEELRGLVKSALKGKIKQVEFVKKFLGEHPQYKEATIKNIINEHRESGAFKSEAVVEGAPLKGVYLSVGK